MVVGTMITSVRPVVISASCTDSQKAEPKPCDWTSCVYADAVQPRPVPVHTLKRKAAHSGMRK